MAADRELIEQIQKGKSDAYGQLFRKYYQPIYSICFSILKNQHDAEEVTSDTFFHAYLKLNQLRKPSKFFAWLKKIAQNRSKNYLRDKREDAMSLSVVSAQTVDDEIAPIQPGVASVQDGLFPLPQIAPDEHLLKQELVDSIMEAVEALPTKDREVVRARIDGLNHSEISERLSISAQASMNRLHRARKKISAHLKDLLNAIFGLPKILPFKTIISGGILAMKIGASTKITIGITGVLIAIFTGVVTTHYLPDDKPHRAAVQQEQAFPVRQTRQYLKSDRRIMNWQKNNQVRDWVAYMPSSEEEASMADDDGPDIVPGSIQIEEFYVGDVHVKIQRYRVWVSRDHIDGTRRAFNQMRKRLENYSMEEELTKEKLKSRIESIQQQLDEMERTGSVPMEMGLLSGPSSDHPRTEEEIEETYREAWAVLAERSRYGRIREPTPVQQGEKASSDKKERQLAKEQSFNDNIIPDSPDESVLGDDIGRLPEEEIHFPSLESSKAMGKQIHPPGADWQSLQDVLGEEPSFDEKRVDIPELSEKEMMELLNWIESAYREDLPDERKDEIFLQFIKKISKKQPHRDSEDVRNRKPPHTDEDKHIDEDEGEHEPN